MLKKIEEVVPDALCSVIGPLLSDGGFESLENGCVDTMFDFFFSMKAACNRIWEDRRYDEQ